MTDQQLTQVLRRLTSVWPREREAGELREWKQVLQTLGYATADRAVDELRDSSKWPPSIADFRIAYRAAAALPEERPALPGVVANLRDAYGYGEWVYCWRCDRAISLDDQDGGSLYDAERGLAHARCPESGPQMSAAQRLQRSEWQERHGSVKTGSAR
jgi:hypothetical protein